MKTATFDKFTVTIPDMAVKPLVQCGVFKEASFWVGKIKDFAPRGLMIEELLKQGNWGKEYLETLEYVDIKGKIVMTAAFIISAREEGNE